MKILLLWIVAVTSTYFASFELFKVNQTVLQAVPQFQIESLDKIKDMIHKEAPTLSMPVLDKVMATLQCANYGHVERNHILSIIDYGLPSNEKRFWIFDLREKKLLFHTYVSHGIKSGTLLTTNFSNKFNSKASSIGVYKTDKSYYGREGLSLRLSGLEVSFNDNASNRSIVMHGGWYVEEDFIKKYGRPGRSWGCPAVPHALYQPIINTIKDNSLLVAYYPSDNWFNHSKFLNCQNATPKPNFSTVPTNTPLVTDNEFREDVLLTHMSNKSGEAIATMKADDYSRIFQTKAPLGRMLRRQIDHVEYIALSTAEFNKLASNNDSAENKAILNAIYFVTPVIVMIRGYYETQMHIVPSDKIKAVKNMDNSKHFTVYFETKPAISLKATDQFIRWVGL